MKSYFIASVLALSLFTVAVSSSQAQDTADDVIFGRQLMTADELADHRARLQELQTDAERQAYGEEHHKAMQARAEERGMTLPDQPMVKGKGGKMMQDKGNIETRLARLEQHMDELIQMQMTRSKKRGAMMTDHEKGMSHADPGMMSGRQRGMMNPHEMHQTMHGGADKKDCITRTRIEERLVVVQTMLEQLLNR